MGRLLLNHQKGQIDRVNVSRSGTLPPVCCPGSQGTPPSDKRHLIFYSAVDVGVLLVCGATVQKRDRRPGAMSLIGTYAPGRTVPAIYLTLTLAEFGDRCHQSDRVFQLRPVRDTCREELRFLKFILTNYNWKILFPQLPFDT